MAAWRLALLGPPGAGKGTLAKELAARHGLRHLSTGEILRAEAAAGTELGRRAREYMSAGRLVPNELVDEVVAVRLRDANGFLLDGYPRNTAQAEFLDTLPAFMLDAVVLVTVSEEEAVKRLTRRRVCRECGGLHAGEDVAVACAECGGELVTRGDDDDATVRKRYEVYARETAPVAAYYRRRNLLREVDGAGSRAEVLARVEGVLAGFGRGRDNG